MKNSYGKLFDKKYQQLVAEGDGSENDKDEYLAENIFFVPQEARWTRISENAHTPEIGKVIDEAMLAIERKNKYAHKYSLLTEEETERWMKYRDNRNSRDIYKYYSNPKLFMSCK